MADTAEKLRRDTCRMVLDKTDGLLARVDVETRDARERGDDTHADALLDLRNDWVALAIRAEAMLDQ